MKSVIVRVIKSVAYVSVVATLVGVVTAGPTVPDEPATGGAIRCGSPDCPVCRDDLRGPWRPGPHGEVIRVGPESLRTAEEVYRTVGPL